MWCARAAELGLEEAEITTGINNRCRPNINGQEKCEIETGRTFTKRVNKDEGVLKENGC